MKASLHVFVPFAAPTTNLSSGAARRVRLQVGIRTRWRSHNVKISQMTRSRSAYPRSETEPSRRRRPLLDSSDSAASCHIAAPHSTSLRASPCSLPPSLLLPTRKKSNFSVRIPLVRRRRGGSGGRSRRPLSLPASLTHDERSHDTRATLDEA